MVYEGRFNEYVYGFKYEEAIENAKRMLVPNWSFYFVLILQMDMSQCILKDMLKSYLLLNRKA